MSSEIRDITLAEAGALKIDWVSHHMPVLNRIRETFEKTRPFEGVTIAVCCHLEAKTAYLGLTLKAGGAEVVMTGSNPLSTQDDVCAALVREGIQVFAWHGATKDEYERHLNLTIATLPDILLDDGGDLVQLLHTTRKDIAGRILGGTEETTTGVLRLKAMEEDGTLSFPMVAVNDAYTKYLFDNRYGTGQSVWDGIMRTTNLVIAGKTVVVAGYGWCGKGVAMRAQGLGAKVVVIEVDPIRALEAHMDGYQVMAGLDAARIGDFFVTVTGCSDVLTESHFAVMKSGAVLTNAGHFNLEIDVAALEEIAIRKSKARTNIDCFHMEDGRHIYLLGEGRLVNLACGDGHPAEIMDMSFGTQALALEHVLAHHKEMESKVYSVPLEIDQKVAMLKLASAEIAIDTLTDTQVRYLSNWRLD